MNLSFQTEGVKVFPASMIYLQYSKDPMGVKINSAYQKDLNCKPYRFSKIVERALEGLEHIVFGSIEIESRYSKKYKSFSVQMY